MNAESDVELFREDLVALKRDVASPIKHMKGGATNTVQDAAGQIKRRVQSMRDEAGAQGDRSAKAINLFIENQPVSGRASPLRLVTLALACFGGEPILFSQRSRHVGSRIASGWRARRRAATNWIFRADRNLAIVLPSLRCDCSGLCAVALWICASPTLGAAGASLVVSAVLCAVGLAAFV